MFTNHHQDPLTSKHRLMYKNLSEALRILSFKISTHVKIAATVSTPDEIATSSPMIRDSSLIVMEDLNEVLKKSIDLCARPFCRSGKCKLKFWETTLNVYVLYNAGIHSSKLTNIGLIKSQSRRHVVSGYQDKSR